MANMSHECYCRQCQPDKFYDGPKLGEGHRSIRFMKKSEDINYDVFCDGAQVKHCYECLVGENGWAIYYCGDDGEFDNEHCHVCRTCHEGVCARVAYGKVHVVKRERQEAI